MLKIILFFTLTLSLTLASPVFAQSSSGNANSDNKINCLDFAVLYKNYGLSLLGSSNGDFDNNGTINKTDYTLWASNYSVTSSPLSSPTPTRTSTPTPQRTPTPTSTPGQLGWLFKDGYESGKSGNNFVNWTTTETTSAMGSASATDDTSTSYEGSHSAKFEVTDGTQGGKALTAKSITWPSSQKLWYDCYFKVDDFTNAAVGGIYLMQAHIRLGTWRDRVDIEITGPGASPGLEPGQSLNSNTFLLRMAYRGRNGARDGHRQAEMIQAPARNVWYHVQMLADLSGPNPHYAWWLNGRFIWQDYDTSVGTDTQAPTELQVGATTVDWAAGNRVRVWVDSCTISTQGPQPN